MVSDAVTVVNGTSNNDTNGQDVGWTVEMMINVDTLGYHIAQPGGDIIEFNLSVYDCDNYWPLVPINLSANRVWWQGPWGNSNGYNEVRVHCKPSVTVNTNPLPYVGPEIIVPNGSMFASPNINGTLTEPVWTNAPKIDIRYGDDALRNSYPGIFKWRGGQYQPTVNGGQAAVLDPGDCTVKYFFLNDSLFFRLRRSRRVRPELQPHRSQWMASSSGSTTGPRANRWTTRCSRIDSRSTSARREARAPATT
jgi:hypothetical protein